MTSRKILTILVLILVCGSLSADDKIHVGVFNGYGGAQTCIWETVESVKIDSRMEVELVSTSDIAAGVLDKLDVLIIPGGSGKSQYLNLGNRNHQRIRDFVRAGKGVVGICAGAYLFSNTPGYACLALNGNKAIDIEHDNRGHGLAKFSLNDAGKKLFPELAKREMNYVLYYEGPVFADAGDEIEYQVFATMESDVHEEGNAPANMTNGKPYLVGNEYGKGRVMSIIAHPEATPGMRWIVPRMVSWVARQELVSYAKDAVRPALFEKEILFTKEMLKKEAACLPVLLYGSEEEKLQALDWLQANLSWSAKRWLQGLLFDVSSKVRDRAASYVREYEMTYYSKDLKAMEK